MRNGLNTWGLGILIPALVLTNCYFAHQAHRYKGALPYLVPGEQVPSLELTNLTESFGLNRLQEDSLSMIFIFRTPCSTCNKNFEFWQQMARILNKHDIHCYGVILSGETELATMREVRSLRFPVFMPLDLRDFRRRFRIKINMAQTILCRGGRVEKMHLGELDRESYTEFLKKAIEMTSTLGSRHRKSP